MIAQTEVFAATGQWLKLAAMVIFLGGGIAILIATAITRARKLKAQAAA
ncbi:MAG: hypothetical protein V4466_14095 [Pseudomonadota bacterium]